MWKKGHLPLQRSCAFQLLSSRNVFLSMSSILNLLNSIRRNWEKVSFSYSDTGDILKILSNYSLFTVDHQCKLFCVHKLVQEVVGESLTESERIKTLWNAFARFALRFYNFFALEKFKLGNLYELDVGDQRNVFSLLLNFLKLTSYMEEEINVP